MHVSYETPALARRISAGWQDKAACATAPDPEAWFPAPRSPETVYAEPLTVCASCPVRRSCLAFGLLNGESGLWGGVQDHDRAAALRELSHGADPDVTLDRLLDTELAASLTS